MKVDLSRQEIEILLAWSEDATRGKFGLGDDPAGLTWEEENLLLKLTVALRES